MRVELMPDEAVLSNDKRYTSFSFHGRVIRFMTSAKLERYTRIVEWDHGYLVVIALYKDLGEVEEYIDLIPILKNLYIEPDDFLAPIQKVRIK